MTDHPITPPPELIAKWAGSMCGYYEAARWGADQELEACCAWLERNNQWARCDIDEFHDARRPKPPSLKEQALELVETYTTPSGRCGARLTPEQCDTIRRALESLDD